MKKDRGWASYDPHLYAAGRRKIKVADRGAGGEDNASSHLVITVGTPSSQR